MTEIAEHEQRLFVADEAVVELYVVDHCSIRLQNVRPSVVVVVDKLGRHSTEQDCFIADTGAIGHIGEGSVPVVVIEAIQLKIQVSNVDVQIPISINISGIDAHAGFIPAIFTGSKSGNQRNVLEGPVVAIFKKEIGPCIVGDRNVRPAIVVQVREHHAHSFGFRDSYTRLFAHVGEGAV